MIFFKSARLTCKCALGHKSNQEINNAVMAAEEDRNKPLSLERKHRPTDLCLSPFQQIQQKLVKNNIQTKGKLTASFYLQEEIKASSLKMLSGFYKEQGTRTGKTKRTKATSGKPHMHQS